MSLGLRKYVLLALSKAEPVLSYLFFLIAAGIFLLLPIFDARKTYFSENNLNANSADFVQPMPTLDGLPHADHFVVEGSRAIGSDRILLIANKNRELSRRTALVVAKMLADTKFLSLDVEVIITSSFNIDGLLEHKARFYRGAIVLDISCANAKLCLDTIGNNGLQPNLDIVNVFVANLQRVGLSADLICRNSSVASLTDIFPKQPTWFEFVDDFAQEISVKNRISWPQYLGYFDYLARSLYMKPTPLGLLRDKGIHTLHLRQDDDAECGDHQQLVRAVESLLRSFNNLNERLHHSFFIWFPMDTSTFVDFEASQLIIVFGIATLVAQAYSTLKACVNFKAEYVCLWACCWAIVPFAVLCELRIGGIVASSAATLMAALMLGWRISWALQSLLNVVFLCLLMGIHPTASKVLSLVLPLQLMFFQKKLLSIISLGMGACVIAYHSALLNDFFFSAALFGTGTSVCILALLSNVLCGICRLLC